MNKINHKAFNRLITLLTLLVILGIFSTLNLLDRVIAVFSALTPFYLAFLIIWIMRPFSDFLQAKRGISSKRANLLSILLNLFILLVALFVVVPILIAQMWDITQNSTQIIDSISANLTEISRYFDLHQINVVQEIQTKVGEYLNIRSITDIVSNIDLGFFTNAFSAIITTVGSITSFILKIVFGYIIAIYLSNDFDGFVEKTLNFMFSSSEGKNKQVFIDSTKALSGYFKGLLLDCTFVMLLMTIGVAIIGVPSPLLFGLIAGLFNVIPYLGPVLGGIPLVFIALSQGVTTAILAIVIVMITQFVESQILQPRIMASSTNLHPVTVILGLIIFGTLFGFVGMLIATPTLAIIAVVLKHSDLDIRI